MRRDRCHGRTSAADVELADDKLVPLQVIYQGTTAASLPPLSKRMGNRFVGWDWRHTSNHWSDLESMKALVDKIVAPWRLHKIRKLGLPAHQKVLWLIDCWSVHKGEPFRTWMKDTHANILVLFIPPNTTSKLQPQDVGVQKTFKTAVMHAFRSWQRARFTRALDAGTYHQCTLQILLKYSIYFQVGCRCYDHVPWCMYHLI
jgi:hypothetical protein